MICVRQAYEFDIQDMVLVDAYGYKPDDRHTYEKLETMLSQDNIYGFVVTDKLTVVGYCYFQIDGEGAHLMSVAVRPAHQNKGYGAQLMEAMENLCIKFGVKSISLEVRKSNSSAIAFYLKREYEIEGLLENHYKNEEDALYMEKGRLR